MIKIFIYELKMWLYFNVEIVIFKKDLYLNKNYAIAQNDFEIESFYDIILLGILEVYIHL